MQIGRNALTENQTADTYLNFVVEQYIGVVQNRPVLRYQLQKQNLLRYLKRTRGNLATKVVEKSWRRTFKHYHT